MSQLGGHHTPIGSVAVLGAGIAGMQAALDCANAGFKVYLIEQQSAIGGNMARLDKTFPTNDCAMCMISPKLVETGRHLNIEIVSNADVVKTEGEAGNFQITVKKRARYVDEEKCNGCGDCERACPVTVKDAFNGCLGQRHAIHRLYPQAIPNVYAISKAAAPPPCRGICPAGVNAQGYVALIAKGKFLESLDVVRERMPFAGICGRVCHHPCETRCNRAALDDPVAVRHLKRFVSDYERELIEAGASIERAPTEAPQEPPPPREERVAVVGGGPAGMTCAGDLAKMGYAVTLFESEDRLGGMMRFGIPAYRLPRDVLDHEITLVTGEGIEVCLNMRLGRDFTLADLKEQGFSAVFVATGAQLSKRIPLEGGDAKGVYLGADFLRDTNKGRAPALGSRVVVIGGGNVAMDVARCALRVNPDSEVSVYCLESREEAPAHEWEIQEALEEGVAFYPAWGPSCVHVENGVANGVEFVRCLSVFDENGRFRPIFDTKQTFSVAADTVILAVGQTCDLSFVEKDVETRNGVVGVDPLTLETSLEGVFAGGDNALGPASLVQAVEHGHRAAQSMHRYMRGTDMHENRDPIEREAVFAEAPADAACVRQNRVSIPVAAPEARKTSYQEIEGGYTPEMAMAEARRCLNCGVCSMCNECVRVCKAGAIDHDMRDREVMLEAGAIIVTGGYEPFDPTIKAEYGYGRYPNVVTSMQFERILSASGPYQGRVCRPSDGKTPLKVAWIQCVGSRDATLGNKYCSSVCCMYATKEAVIAREHEPDLQPTIFHIDIRAFGKGYEEFYVRARERYGVRYIRSLVSSLKENPRNRNVIVRYGDDSAGQARIVEEEFDLVVLSVGMVPRRTSADLCRVLGMSTNEYGFACGNPELPLLSGKEGVYLCGTVSGPKDIPETVMESSAAAALCGQLLSRARGTQTQKKEYPPERDILDEPPRIGVFICHCGTNIASVVDVAAVAEYVQSMPGLIYAEHTLYSCSQDTQERIKDIIQDKNLNRVIVASCTPRTHEPLFQETLREAGLNKYMFEMADIREQCAWVHQQEPAEATEKAKALVRGSIGKARGLEPLQIKRVGITRCALVVGGGIAGLTAAVSLARQGFSVELVEREATLGGQLIHLERGLEGQNWRRRLDKLIEQATHEPAITVHLNAEIDEVSGVVGNFSTRLKGKDAMEIKHGVIILATGAKEYQPEGFLFGEDKRVMTQRALGHALRATDAEPASEQPAAPPQTVVMIQCVGSRDAERPYCSRVCCGAAVKNALAVKERFPDAVVYILYRDIRTYQYKEEYYWQARDNGVRFIRFPDDAYPEVRRDNGRLTVTVNDAALMETITLCADWLVLSAAIVPDAADNARTAELMKAPLNDHGFFMEAHVKLRPVDFANEGIFVCGLAHSPKYTEENIAQALAAAGRAAVILAKDYLEVGGVVSRVNPDLCATCLTCVRECLYQAPFVNEEGKAEIEAAKCQGCGNCAAACPAKAIELQSFTDLQETALVRALLNDAPLPSEQATFQGVDK